MRHDHFLATSLVRYNLYGEEILFFWWFQETGQLPKYGCDGQVLEYLLIEHSMYII